MGARRGLTDGETFEADSAQSIYRSTPRAARGSMTDETSSFPAIGRVARRRMSDDTGTIRPGWRATAPVTTTIIRIKHATPTPQSKRGRILLVAAMVPVLVAVTIASLGFLSNSHQAPPLDAPYVAVAAVPDTDGANGGALGDAVDDSSTLSAAAGTSRDAIAADAQVKAQSAAAASLAQAAGTAAEEKAKAAARSGGGHTAADFSDHDIAGTPVVVPDGAVIWPVSGFTIVSPFGWRIHPVYHVWKFHTGVDLSIGCGKPIYASADGVVTYSGWDGGYGNYVEIKSKDLGLSLGYAHQSKIVATLGQQVAQGQLIGYVGATGVATGCHVHFQAINGKGMFFDPTTLVH